MHVLRSSTIIALLVMALLRGALASPVTVISKTLAQKMLGGRFVAHATYPQLSGLSNASVETRINALLADRSWPTSWEAGFDVEPGEVYSEEVKYTVTLNAVGLLSLKYSGLGVLTLNGRINEAHPTKLIKALTIDLGTGKVYAVADLFRSGAPYQALVSERVQKAYGFDPGDSWSYYLTPRKLVVIFPDAPFAVQSAEVAIPLSSLASLARADGPIPRLLKR